MPTRWSSESHHDRSTSQIRTAVSTDSRARTTINTRLLLFCSPSCFLRRAAMIAGMKLMLQIAIESAAFLCKAISWLLDSSTSCLTFLAPIHNYMVVDQLGTTFAALSDPTRRRMIERLAQGPATVHGLTEPFAISQQMISKHIACLVRARIVVKTKRGRESVCTLRPEAIRAVSDWAFSYRRFWEESFDKLEEVVQRMKLEAGNDAEYRADGDHEGVRRPA